MTEPNGNLPNVASWSPPAVASPVEALSYSDLVVLAAPVRQPRPVGWCDSPEGHLYSQARVELFKRMNQAIAAKKKKAGK
jgi:hypothetical protein